MSGVQPTARSASGSVAMPVTVAAAEHGDQPWVTATEASGVHLRIEVGDRPVDERLEVATQPLGAGLGEPAQLANESEQRRRAHGGAEHGHDDRVDAVERIVGRRPHGCLDRRGELRGGVGEHGVDELVLGGEPVQHRLLAHPDDGGDLVERHGVDAASPEQLDGGLEDPRPRRRDGGPRRQSVYHLVENRARPVARDRRGARRQTDRHHRVDRLRRHGAGRAPAAQRSRTATSCCSSATASGRPPPSVSSASCSRTTPSTGCASSTAAMASAR